MHAPVEYHLEISASNGTHGDFAADTPFPAISVGDVLVAGPFITGGTMGIPDNMEQVVTRVEHHFQYVAADDEKKNYQHFTTVCYTEIRAVASS